MLPTYEREEYVCYVSHPILQGCVLQHSGQDLLEGNREHRREQDTLGKRVLVVLVVLNRNY